MLDRSACASLGLSANCIISTLGENSAVSSLNCVYGCLALIIGIIDAVYYNICKVCVSNIFFAVVLDLYSNIALRHFKNIAAVQYSECIRLTVCCECSNILNSVAFFCIDRYYSRFTGLDSSGEFLSSYRKINFAVSGFYIYIVFISCFAGITVLCIIVCIHNSESNIALGHLHQIRAVNSL